MVTQIVRRELAAQGALVDPGESDERVQGQVRGHNVGPVKPTAAAGPAPERDLDNVTLAQAAANSTKLRAARTRTRTAGRAAVGMGPPAEEGSRAPTIEADAAQEGLDLIIGRRIGPFRFTPKQSFHKSGGKHGGWEVFCPFHAKNYKSGCRKWFPILGPALRDKQVAANAALAWCAAASTVDKHCLHLAYPIDYNAAPLASVTRALPIFQTDAPSTRVIPDSEMMRSDDVVPAPKAKARSRKRVEGHGDTLHKDDDGAQPLAKMPRKGVEC